MYRENRNIYRVLVRKPEEKGLLEDVGIDERGYSKTFLLGIFHWHNPSCRTVALGSTQLFTKMSTRNIFWEVKAAGACG